MNMITMLTPLLVCLVIMAVVRIEGRHSWISIRGRQNELADRISSPALC
jgi:hypothetical protein